MINRARPMIEVAGRPLCSPAWVNGSSFVGSADQHTQLNEVEFKKLKCWRIQFKKMHPAGVEPATLGSEDRCSIQLSYGCKMLQLNVLS